MAKIKSAVFEEASGKLGKGLVVRQTVHGAILAKAPKKASQPRRSEDQARNRGQLANIGSNHRLYDGRLVMSYESKPTGLSDFNVMVQVNWGVNPVYITKQMRLNGACVVAPYIYCRGTLNTIGMAVSDGGVLVTDLSLGDLVIGSGTTVAELAAAVLKHNRGWDDGDQLTFFYAKQYVDALGTPRATMDSEKVVLDISDETALSEVVSDFAGLCSVHGEEFMVNGSYVLGMSEALVNAGASWCHSRNNGSQLKVSTQRLVVVSDILVEYQGYEAMKRCAESYGGVNTKAVYLNPRSQDSMTSLDSLTSQTSQTSQDSQTSPTSQNSQTSQTGGDGQNSQGDGIMGNGTTETGNNGNTESVTVEAPVFSGETQFTESTQVTMTAESGAEIRYTTDGSEPSASSTLYSGAVTLTETTTVKAIAIKDGVSSTVTSRTYTKGSNSGDSSI